MPAAGLSLFAFVSGPAIAQTTDKKADAAVPAPQAAPPAKPTDPNAPQTKPAQTPPPTTTPPNPAYNGPRIGEIIVTGNKTLSSAYIIAASGHKVGDPCTDQTLSEMQTNLVRTGYFGEHSTDVASAVRVHSEEYNPPNGQCKVIIEVDENDTIRSVNITGSGPIKPEEIQKLLHVNLQTGTVYNEEQFARDFQDIQDLYRRQGYIVIPAQDAGPDPKNPSVLNVDLIVARVSEIKITGNHKTKTKVILREMRTKTGDYYNENTLNKDVLRLYNMDIFDDVVPQERTVGPGQISITISVVEKRTGTFNVGVGYSERESLIGFAELSDTNFRGMGEQLSLRWNQSVLISKPDVELSFTEPWLDSHQTALNVQLYNRIVYRFANTISNALPVTVTGTTASQYYEQRLGSTITVSRPFANVFRGALSLRAENVRSNSLDLSPRNAIIVQNGPIESVSGSLIHNTRDLDLDPVSGGFHVASMEIGHANLRPAVPFVFGGVFGNINFIKNTLEARQYYSLQGPRPRNKPDEDKRSVALRLMLGGIGGQVPFSEQYFLGGAESLRGYRDDRFWGKYMILGSIEYRHPLARKLKGVLFLDVGDAWGGPYQYVQISGFQQGPFHPHIGIGPGIRVTTPLGPVRLDFGFGDEGSRIHFSVGNVF